jgi:hypothetical protein
MGSGIYDQPDGPPVLFGDCTVFEFVGEAVELVVFLLVKIGRTYGVIGRFTRKLWMFIRFGGLDIRISPGVRESQHHCKP